MIEIVDHGAVRQLRLARPPANALSRGLVAALDQAVAAAPEAGARAVVIAGAPGMFSGGLDVPELLPLDRAAIADAWRGLFGLLYTLAASPIPIAAAITGHAPAGGTVIALCADRRFAADGPFKIGLNEVRIGLHLPPTVHRVLRHLVGPAQASRLAVGGLLLAPAEALAAGLVDQVVPADQVVDRAVAWCEEQLALPPFAMSSTRRDARADLIALIAPTVAGANAETKGSDEIDQVVDAWFHPEAQAALRALVARLTK